MRSQPRSARAVANFGQALVDPAILYRRAAALIFASSLRQLSMHMDQAYGAGTLVQVIHVLRAQKKSFPELLFESSEGQSSGSRSDSGWWATPRTAAITPG